MKKLALVLLAFIFSVAPCASAQSRKIAPAKGTARSLDDKISLDLDGAAFSDVLKTLEELSGFKIAIRSRGPVGPITLNVQNVRLRTALDAVCDGLSATWALDSRSNPATIHVDVPSGSGDRDETLTLDQPITLRLADADARDVLRSCARLLGVRTEMSTGVCGTVTLDARETPLSRFLDEVCRQSHCRWNLDRGPNDPVLRVVPASPGS